MCVSPTVVFRSKGNQYERLEVPCRVCWSCLKNKQNALIGKALCESASSEWNLALTLTYDDKRIDPLQAKMIHKDDFQLFMKRLRTWHLCRYVCAGEYGKRKGRAHFHVLLFGHGRPPVIPFRRNVRPEEFTTPGGRSSYWPYGHVFADHVNEATIRYVAKYLTKSRDPKNRLEGERDETWVSYSNKPSLGEVYFDLLADQYVSERVLPRSFLYFPPGGKPGENYLLEGVPQMRFLDRIYRQWPNAVQLRKTEWMENATLRWKKWKAKWIWDNELSPEEQLYYIRQSMHEPPYRRGLTQEQLSRELFVEGFFEILTLDERLSKRWLAGVDVTEEHQRAMDVFHRLRDRSPLVQHIDRDLNR